MSLATIPPWSSCITRTSWLWRHSASLSLCVIGYLSTKASPQLQSSESNSMWMSNLTRIKASLDPMRSRS